MMKSKAPPMTDIVERLKAERSLNCPNENGTDFYGEAIAEITRLREALAQAFDRAALRVAGQDVAVNHMPDGLTAHQLAGWLMKRDAAMAAEIRALAKEASHVEGTMRDLFMVGYLHSIDERRARHHRSMPTATAAR